MFTGDYNFFDYKSNIEGYDGQDFGTFPQHLYLVLSLIIIIVLLLIFRKKNKTEIRNIIRGIGIFLIIFYISKTTWESYYDIKYTGSFNYYLLPFDTCSFIMLTGLISGFAKGKIKEYSDAWIATGCIVGGIASMIFLNAFKYYPFLSFGAFYSMIWHFLMVFIGLLLIVTSYVPIEYKTVIKGFLFHLIVSLVVIPIDFIFDFDFMLYKNLGGIPMFEGIASDLTSKNLGFINPIIMLILYFVVFNIIFLIPLLIKRITNKKKEH